MKLYEVQGASSQPASSQSSDWQSAGSSSFPSFPAVNLDGERSEPSYVHSSANQISQPTVFEWRKLTSEGSVLVAEWEYSEFVWLSKFLVELPACYRILLDLLEVDTEDYSLELHGFYCYHHKRDPYRRCDVDSIYLPIIRCGKYHPYSSVKHRRRASSRALDRLEFLEEECRKRRVKFEYLIKIDLTLPKQISELWDSEKVERCIRKAVRDFLRELHREMFGKLHRFGGYHSQFGAISNHHFWATRSPLEPHRHIHLTIPNVVYNPKSGTFHRFRPYIEEGLIKDVWYRCLKKNGLWVDVPDHVKPDAYVGFIKFEDRNKVIHRLSYCCRKPIEDLVTNLTDSDLVDFDEEFVLFLLNYTPRRVNLGFLTNLKRFGYSRKPSLLKCPICGGEMFVERDHYGNPRLWDRPPPEIPKLYRDRKGDWRETINLVTR